MSSFASIPLGYCVSEVRRKNLGGREQNLLSLSYGRIIRKDIDSAEGLLPESFDTYNIVEQGDTVLRLTDLQNDQRSLRVGLVEERGIITSAYVTVRPSSRVNERFLNYFLKMMDFRKDFYALGAGVRQSLKFEELRGVQVAVPGLAVQRAIADYLDTETARIDALITKKQRMIELLEERLAVGLDRALGPADSGIRLKHCADLLPGYAFSSEEFSAESPGPRLLRGINVNPESVVWDEAVRLDLTASAPPRYRLEADDVVVGMDRPFVSSGTRVAIVDADAAGSFLVQRVCRLRTPSPATAVLVAAALRSPRFRAYVEADLSGVSVPHLSDAQIGMYVVPDSVAVGDVSRAEQITTMTKSHRLLTSLVSLQIDLIREHRQTLIIAAVTGELEVPGVAA